MIQLTKQANPFHALHMLHEKQPPHGNSTCRANWSTWAVLAISSKKSYLKTSHGKAADPLHPPIFWRGSYSPQARAACPHSLPRLHSWNGMQLHLLPLPPSHHVFPSNLDCQLLTSPLYTSCTVHTAHLMYINNTKLIRLKNSRASHTVHFLACPVTNTLVSATPHKICVKNFAFQSWKYFPFSFPNPPSISTYNYD